jgi:hypothetical protein
MIIFLDKLEEIILILEDGFVVKCMVMSRDQDAWLSYSITIGKILFETVKHFKYLVIALTNKNSIQ